MASALAQAATGRAVPFVVRQRRDGVIVGSTRFLDLDVFDWPPAWPPGGVCGPAPSSERPPTVGEIGSTWYHPSVQGTGVNADTKLLLLAQAFESWKMLRVSLKTDARNATSRRAIARLGAHFEGIRRAHSPAVDGTIRDSAYYSIVADEWPVVRDALVARLGDVSAAPCE